MTDGAHLMVLGGGLAGLSFAISLATEVSGAEITVLEAHPFRSGTPNPLDTRASALNLHSVEQLDLWGVWPALVDFAGSIEEIHVSHRGHFGSTLMTASDLGTPALGYVVENHDLGRALLARAEALGIQVRAPLRCSNLLVDGAGPGVETEDGEQLRADLVLLAAGVMPDWFQKLGIQVNERPSNNHAVVFNASFPGEQGRRAFERFTAHGPLAVLPLPSGNRSEQRYNVVWSMSDAQLSVVSQLDDAAFINEFQGAFGWRLGRVRAVGKRSQWPLGRLVTAEQFRSGYLLVGNAAHTLHPVAGQGLNLTMREADMLSGSLADAISNGEPIGELDSLTTYLKHAADEQFLVTRSTDVLSTLFDRRGPLLDAPRNVSLALLDLLPGARAQVARLGTGHRDARY